MVLPADAGEGGVPYGGRMQSAGSVTLIPQPIQLPRPRRTVWRRAGATVGGGARRLGPVAIKRVVLRRPLDNADVARRMRLLFDDLGGMFTKLGQLIACAE